MASEQITGVYVEMPWQPGIIYAVLFDSVQGWICVCGVAAFGLAPVVGDACSCGAKVRLVWRGVAEPPPREVGLP